MARKRQPKIVRKSRNRGRTISVFLHALLLLLAFLPFLSFQAPDEASKEALVIQFDYPFNQYVKSEKFVLDNAQIEESSKMSGSEAGGSKLSPEPRQSRPVEAAPSRIASPQVTSVSRTSTSLLSSKMSDIPLPAPKIVTHQAWQSVNDFDSFEADGVEELKIIDWSDGAGKNDVGGSEPGDDDSDITSEGFGTGTGGTGGTGEGQGNATGAGSGPGGGTGVGSAGKNTGVGNNGTGLEWGVGLGKGFTRKVIKRGINVGNLAVKEGHISISFCVDRSGKVIRTKYNSMGSSIREPDLIRKAEDCAASYIFEPDATAPVEQCGTYTFIFKIK